MPRIELFARAGCLDAATITGWLLSNGHAPLWRDLADANAAQDLRHRTGLGIAPVTLVDGRPVWGHGDEQVRRLRRMLRPRRWTLAW